MLAPGSENEECLGFRSDWFAPPTQKDGADFFSQGRPARLPCFYRHISLSPEILAQQSCLGRLAAPFDSFERNEQASRQPPALSLHSVTKFLAQEGRIVVQVLENSKKRLATTGRRPVS